MRLFEAWVPGRVPVKKNTQRVVGRGRGKHVIYSPKFLAWERTALANLRIQSSVAKAAGIDCPLEAVFRFYFKNRSGEADVSNLVEGVQDALTKAGIISDDRIIRRVIAEKWFGYEPGVEIVLYRFEEVAA